MGISGSAIVSSTSTGERSGRRMRALRPGRWASGPHHTAHSSTSPANEVHWASVPSGMASCGIEGESLAPVAGTAVATWSTNSHVGWISSSRKTRLIRPCRPVSPGTRRAGSSHTPTRERSGSRGASNSSASPTRARESGHGRRLMSAMAAVTGSMSTPCTVTPSADIATASDPMPQPRSCTVASEAL